MQSSVNYRKSSQIKEVIQSTSHLSNTDISKYSRVSKDIL